MNKEKKKRKKYMTENKKLLLSIIKQEPKPDDKDLKL